jgi:hypothetical protein
MNSRAKPQVERKSPPPLPPDDPGVCKLGLRISGNGYFLSSVPDRFAIDA